MSKNKKLILIIAVVLVIIGLLGLNETIKWQNRKIIKRQILSALMNAGEIRSKEDLQKILQTTGAGAEYKKNLPLFGLSLSKARERPDYNSYDPDFCAGWGDYTLDMLVYSLATLDEVGWDEAMYGWGVWGRHGCGSSPSAT